ncbi:hypothetical protein HYY71_00735 [Candidatus Woesearchaeota archaeon]|nr:hypothetical protein [Candidatus Woesearchaeota archaeon]
MKDKIKSEEIEEDFDNIKEEDISKEVHFKIDKDAFKAPFTCHGRKTILVGKKLSIDGIDFNYSVWQCKTCKKEYLDLEQGRKLEKFWVFKRLLEDKVITIERNMNYDGKTFFFRFPKELTKDLHKDDLVDIKLLSPEGKMFLVEIRHGK